MTWPVRLTRCRVLARRAQAHDWRAFDELRRRGWAPESILDWRP